MKDFDHFYILLVEDQKWYENASVHHTKETFEATARKVWTIGLADFENFKSMPMREHRNHLFNKLCKIPPDKKREPWNKAALHELEKEKPEPVIEEPPLVRGSEQYLKRTQEYIDAIQAMPMLKRNVPLSAKERLEGKEWRVKPQSIREPSDFEKRKAAIDHYHLIREQRGKLYLESYPDAPTEEVQAYLDTFKKLDDPLNLF